MVISGIGINLINLAQGVYAPKLLVLSLHHMMLRIILVRSLLVMKISLAYQYLTRNFISHTLCSSWLIINQVFKGPELIFENFVTTASSLLMSATSVTWIMMLLVVNVVLKKKQLCICLEIVMTSKMFGILLLSRSIGLNYFA